MESLFFSCFKFVVIKLEFTASRFLYILILGFFKEFPVRKVAIVLEYLQNCS